MMVDASPLIDPKLFRQVLGQYPTGVCVVTSMMPDGHPAAMVVGSFTSVSLEPPLVGFFPDRGSSSWPKVAANGRFCVNILSADQEGICRKLASKDADKFASIEHQLSPLGSPIIDGVVAWIDCELHNVGDAGDHFVVFGLVRQMEIADGGLPLLFFQGGYGKFAPSSLAASDQHGSLTVQLRLVDRARTQMERLAEDLSAVCMASARIGSEVVIIANAGQPRRSTPVTLVGQRLPFVPPTGAVFAAWLNDAEITQWIGAGTTSHRAEQYRAALAAVRCRRYSVGLASEAQRAFAAKLHELARGSTEPAPDLGELISELRYDPPVLDDETSAAVRLISAPVFVEGQTVGFALTLHDFPRPTNARDVEELASKLLETTDTLAAEIHLRH